MNYTNPGTTIYCFAISITQIANLLPFTPGGFGIGEIAFSKSISLFTQNFQASYATIFIAYRLIGLILYLPSIMLVAANKSKYNSSPIETTH
jgi:uncharacterized membrane protein YbhN (UPF0104 family)